MSRGVLSRVVIDLASTEAQSGLEATMRAWRADVPPLLRLLLLALAETPDLRKAAGLAGIGYDEAKWMFDVLVARGCILLPQPVIEKKRKRRALPRALREAIFLRDGRECKHCGRIDHLTIDHIKPVHHGGGDEPTNLQVLCMPCNSSKGIRWP